MQLQPKNEAEEILRELNEISAEDRKNELLLQRYKHKANALIRSADLFAGHILLGAVSAIERDAEAMHHHHKIAMSYGNGDPQGYMNYAVSLARFGLYPESVRYAKKAFQKDPFYLPALNTLIFSNLYMGRMNETLDLIRKQNKIGETHPLSEDVRKAVEIMERYKVTDKETEQLFRIMSDLLAERKIYIRSADFSIMTDGDEEWIHYNYDLDTEPELLPETETELNIRWSERLSPHVFNAVETDVTAPGDDALCLSEDISDVITANDSLMEKINRARHEMREGIRYLSHKEVFGG
jgi:tetratricopeptide (TPR) repeat protein